MACDGRNTAAKHAWPLLKNLEDERLYQGSAVVGLERRVVAAEVAKDEERHDDVRVEVVSADDPVPLDPKQLRSVGLDPAHYLVDLLENQALPSMGTHLGQLFNDALVLLGVLVELVELDETSRSNLPRLSPPLTKVGAILILLVAVMWF